MGKLNENLEIKTYGLAVESNDIYREINSLVIENIKNNTLPYVQEIPLPQDMNVINGKHLADVNKVQLELKAAKIGAKNLKWVYGADAVVLGLELKEKGIDTEPIIVLANTKRNLSRSTTNIENTSDIAAEGLQIEAQTVYLLDQFSDKSIEKALSQSRIEQQLELRGNELARKKKTILAKNMLKNIAEYDSGRKEEGLRNDKTRNIKENFSNPEIRPKVAEAYQNITKNLDDSQKNLFNVTHSYYLKQETGCSMKVSPEAKKQMVNNLWQMANEDNPMLAKTLTQSVLYTERATHYQFEFNQIYNEKDLNQKLSVTPPNAARFKDEQINSIIDQRVAGKLREREREFKPRQITHQRGF